jgi:gluconate transporter
MTQSWPALCAAVALGVLLLLIIRYKLQAFVALLLVGLGLGLAAGLPPVQVVKSVGVGVGDILGKVAILLALGAILGKLLDVSGAAEVIARTLINAFGVERASLAILVAAYVIGIPVLFNVGFLLLIAIMWRLQRETGKSLLYYVLPLSFSLGITHSLIPPHPGIIGAVGALAPVGQAGAIMVQTILFGTLLGIPLVLVGWFGPARWWAARQFVTVPEHLAAVTAPQEKELSAPPSFAVSILIVTLPLSLSLLGFGVDLLARLQHLPGWMLTPLFGRSHAPVDWLRFVGDPTMALLTATTLAFVLLGLRRGLGLERLSRLAGDAIQEVGPIALLFGAAGGFMQIIEESGAGKGITGLARLLPLTPVAYVYLVAVLARVALGSATAAILLASSLLKDLARTMPGQETLLVLSVASGVTFMTQPADSGFWMVKEYCNLSVRDVMVRFNACRITMSLVGLVLLLVYEWLMVASGSIIGGDASLFLPTDALDGAPP